MLPQGTVRTLGTLHKYLRYTYSILPVVANPLFPKTQQRLAFKKDPSNKQIHKSQGQDTKLSVA